MIQAYPAEVTRPLTGYAPIVARPIVVQQQPQPGQAPQPILQNSILQPTQNTSDLIRVSLQQSDYIAPGQTPLPPQQNPGLTTPISVQTQTIFGIDQNTFWLILLVVAAILIAVMA